MGVVVVGVDLSPTSTEAVKEAVRQATWRNGSVLVLYVVMLPAYMGMEPGAFRFDPEELRLGGEKALDDQLAQLEASYDGGFPVEVERLVVLGHPGSQILHEAEKVDAELVVLGSRGLGGFRGLLVGSVTTYAIHHLTTPLLVVPVVEEDA